MLNERFYYQDWKCQYAMIPYLKDRELSILPAKNKQASQGLRRRNIRCHNIQSFQFWLNYFRLFESPEKFTNFYYSMGKYREGVPYLYDKGKLDKDKSETWKDNAHESLVSYDMLIDIDAGDFSEMEYAVESSKAIKSFFDLKNIPYLLRFSGMGFHFVIPYNYFPSALSLNPFKEPNIYQYMKLKAKILYDKYSEMVDYSIYDSRRIAKIPYSLSIYEEGTYMCCPVNNLETFNYENYNLAKFKKDKLLNDNITNITGSLDGFKNA